MAGPSRVSSPNFSVARLIDGEGEQADPCLLGDGGALPRRPLSPYLYLGDRLLAGSPIF